MKVVLDKKVFSMDEVELINQFKGEWNTPTAEDIRTAANALFSRLDIRGGEIVAVSKVELTKNRFKPTYWISMVVKGRDAEANEIYAEIDFDYVQAIMADDESSIDNYTQIYKRS